MNYWGDRDDVTKQAAVLNDAPEVPVNSTTLSERLRGHDAIAICQSHVSQGSEVIASNPSRGDGRGDGYWGACVWHVEDKAARASKQRSENDTLK